MSARRSHAGTHLLVASAAAFVTAAAAIGPAPARAGEPPPPPVPDLTWLPCGEEFPPSAECAVAEVPLDHDRPHGAKTSVALARVAASDPADKIGTVFVNPGGPGGSGVDLIRFGFGDFLAERLQGRFDVVGFDPRGIARSEKLQCFETNEERDAFFAELPVFPFERAQERPYFRRYNAFTRDCVGSHQRIRAHMSTADVARDIDLLRQAVGDERLTYLGISYGSFLGTTYAVLFPDKVRALVIDGVLDPIQWTSGLQIVADRVATREEFDEFLRLCDEAGADLCPLSGPEGASARFDALADAVRSAPLEFPDGTIYSYDFLVADATGAMYAPEVWGGPDGAGAFFGLLADFALGDGLAGSRALGAREAIAAFLHGDARADDYDNFLEGFFGNHCADVEYPRTLRAFQAVADFAAAGSIFGPYWWWNTAVSCAEWPTAPDRFTGPWETRTSAPVLVVGNFFDGVTSYDAAVSTSRLLENSRLLSYAGWGHAALGRSACATDYMVSYLFDGSLPPEGTVCPANPNPFLPSELSLAPLVRPAPLVGLPLLRPPGR